MKKRISLCAISISLAFFLNAQEKIKIGKAEDLPKHNYQLSETNLSMLVSNNEQLLDLAASVESDLESDIGKYDFADASILKNFYGNLSVIALLQKDYNSVLEYVYKSRELADKESEKLVRSCELEAYSLAIKETGVSDLEKLQSTIREYLGNYLDSLSFDIIQEDMEERKGRADLLNENLLMGLLTGEMQSTVDKTEGNVPFELAARLLNIKASLEYYIPNREVYGEVFTELISRKGVEIEKHNIWEDRDVSLNELDKYSPIIVGIWDSGVDMDVFPDNNKWENKQEKLDGIDNDKNGYIDDIHGVAYDYEGVKAVELLFPEALNLENLDQKQNMMRGLVDMMANVDSEYAKSFKKESSAMTPEEYEQFFETLKMLGLFNHGTHVAGIAVEGNPFAEILCARLSFDHKTLPDVPTMETAERWGQMYIDVLAYFRKYNVKVVNMSWSVDLRIDILPALRKNGIGKDEEERFEIAKKMFAIHEKAFTKAMEATPDILFVTSAGNSNNDVDFAGSVPSSFNYPNILTVGAVDIEGKKTDFTTEGESVDVYANGYEVDSYIPGGSRMKLSGTSMSSPNCVNLAAKIFAVDPKLSAKEVKEIIVDNATPSEEDPNVLLIHPRNSIEAVKAKN